MKRLIIALLAILMLFSITQAQQVVDQWPITLTWNANSESDLAGYRMYHATVSFAGVVPYGASQAEIPAGTGTVDYTITVPGFHYFLVTAFDNVGNESGPSNEVSFEADATPPAPCQGLTVTAQ